MSLFACPCITINQRNDRQSETDAIAQDLFLRRCFLERLPDFSPRSLNVSNKNWGEEDAQLVIVFWSRLTSRLKRKLNMSSSPPSTEPKTTTNDEDTAESVYSVEEDDSDERESETDAFSRVKPSLLKTPSVLNAIIDQIHPDILAKFVDRLFFLPADHIEMRCSLYSSSLTFRSHQSNYVLFPPQLEGCTVVDLGCGVGRDVFILSKLVGDKGRVIGIDSEKDQVRPIEHFIQSITDQLLKSHRVHRRAWKERVLPGIAYTLRFSDPRSLSPSKWIFNSSLQLNLARKFIDYHKNKFGLLEINVEFLHGEIDRLEQTKIAENSVDVVV